jgi:large subunit ribosomal protein L28
MSCRCELSGIGVLSGNLVSHSQIKTKRKFKPNMKVARFFSDIVGEKFSFRVSVRAIRSVEKIGSFDQYMINTSEKNLSDYAKMVRKKILKKREAIA